MGIDGRGSWGHWVIEKKRTTARRFDSKKSQWLQVYIEKQLVGRTGIKRTRPDNDQGRSTITEDAVNMNEHCGVKKFHEAAPANLCSDGGSREERSPVCWRPWAASTARASSFHGLWSNARCRGDCRINLQIHERRCIVHSRPTLVTAATPTTELSDFANLLWEPIGRKRPSSRRLTNRYFLLLPTRFKFILF